MKLFNEGVSFSGFFRNFPRHQWKAMEPMEPMEPGLEESKRETSPGHGRHGHSAPKPLPPPVSQHGDPTGLGFTKAAGATMSHQLHGNVGNVK